MDGLWVILLEAFIVLYLLLGIVWATWPKGTFEHRHVGAVVLSIDTTSRNKEKSQ